MYQVYFYKIHFTDSYRMGMLLLCTVNLSWPLTTNKRELNRYCTVLTIRLFLPIDGINGIEISNDMMFNCFTTEFIPSVKKIKKNLTLLYLEIGWN